MTRVPPNTVPPDTVPPNTVPPNTAPQWRRTIVRLTAGATGQLGRYDKLGSALEWAHISAEEVAERQLASLRRLLTHAGANVPYYRDLFARHRFDPGAVTSPAALAALPPLTKADVRAAGERLLADGADVSDLLRRKTGGSTGEPLEFFVTRDEYETQLAANLRSFALVGVWPGDTQAKIWGYNKPQDWGNRLAPLTGKLFFDAYHASAAEMDDWLRRMQRIRPKMIYGYASTLAQLARHAEQRGQRVPGLQVVCSTAEKLHEHQRLQIERGLDARVSDMYGCHEVPRLASECLEGRMHLCPDQAVVEFVDGEDESAPKRMLLTSLTSYAMPLIRYDVGDYGRPSSAPCSCGLPFPTMSMDVGKVHHVFELPSGEGVHTSYFYKPLYKLTALRTFQIRHEAPDHIVVRAVPAESVAGAEAAIAPALHDFAERLGDDARVTVEWVDDIPPTAAGKRPLIVSLPAGAR